MQIKSLPACLGMLTVLTLASGSAQTRAQPVAQADAATHQTAANPEASNDGRHDFDFLSGKWQFHNRKLVGLFKGSTEWQEFDGITEGRAIIGGMGNIDEWHIDSYRPGFLGTSLRLFDPVSRQWSTYEMDNRSGKLSPAVVGAFNGSTGTFEGVDEMDGTPIRVRYTWSVQDPAKPTWYQAFSKDGGKTWETNWHMEFSRSKD